MSYKYPYQSSQSAYYPPPPPPRRSQGPSYSPVQAPPLPPRPAPSSGSPDVQDLTSGFAQLSAYEQPPFQPSYIPHAEYHQAASTQNQWRLSQPTTLSPTWPSQHEYRPPLPPRPASQSPWQGPWQTPQPSPVPSESSFSRPISYPPRQPWQQVPVQSSWTSPSIPASNSGWQQTKTYNRPPPPPPAELIQAQAPTQSTDFRPASIYAQPNQQPFQGYNAPSPVPSISSWSQGTSAWTPTQHSYQQPSPLLNAATTYYPPPGSQDSTPTQSSPGTHSLLNTDHLDPQPTQIVFEMEGSTPGVSESRKPKVEPTVAKRKPVTTPEKLQRTFTDTLRQAGPYYYTPPAPAVDVEEEGETDDVASVSKQESGPDTFTPESSSTGGSVEVNSSPVPDGERKQSGPESIEPATPAENSEPSSDMQTLSDRQDSRPCSYTPEHAEDATLEPAQSPKPDDSNEPPHQPTQEQDQQPLAGAVATSFYLQIPNPPANIPADQADDYFVSYQCPYPDAIYHSDLFWFTHTDVPDFRLCAYCFEQHVRHTSFASSFTGKLESKELKLRCGFSAPRLLDQLWPQAVRTGNLGLVKEYMEKRVQVTNCHGVGGVTGAEASGVRWFKMRNKEIPEFLICEACLEEEIVVTAFESQFTQYLEPQGQDQRWSCDVAFMHLRRGLAHALKAGDWNSFVRVAYRRLSLPTCEGVKAVKACSREWYTPATPIDGVVICEACYLDNFALTQFRNDFVRRPVEIQHSANEFICDLSAVGVKSAVDVAHMTSSITPVHTVLRTLQTTNPPCGTGPISSTTWYTLAAPTPNFDVCPTCHAGLFAIVPGLSHLLRPTTTAHPTTRICDFSPHTHHYIPYILHYITAVNTPSGLSPFLAYISALSTQPPCPRRTPARNLRWHILPSPTGAPDLVACASCHHAAIAPTPLAALLTTAPPAEPLDRVCDMYSANMRARWRHLCAHPDSLDEFLAYSRHRHDVYAQTVPACRMLVEHAKLRRQQNALVGAMGSHYSLMNGITAPGSQIRYGPAPTVAYSYGGFETPYGAQAAAAGAQGVNLLTEMMADTAKVKVLEARWMEVE